METRSFSEQLHQNADRQPPWGSALPGTIGLSSNGSFPALSSAACAASWQLPRQLQAQGDLHQPLGAPARDLQQAVALAQPCVVAVAGSSGSWASGVVACARNGYVVTNAHLLVERSAAADRGSTAATPAGAAQRAYPSSVTVQIWPQDTSRAAVSDVTRSRRAVWARAAVVFVFQGALDVAILQVDSSARGHLQQIKLRDIRQAPSAAAGERIAVLGFPLFSPRFSLGHVTTAGVISKVCANCISTCLDHFSYGQPAES